MKKIFLIMMVIVTNMVLPSEQLSQGDQQWINNPQWGFKFKVPKDWVSYTDNSAVVLVNEGIAGVIFIFPHQSNSLDEMEEDMKLGIEEEDIQLSLSGKLKKFGKEKIVGEYSGYYDFTLVKGRGVGILSPYGGGAYFISLTSDDKYVKKVSEISDGIIKSTQFSKPLTGSIQHEQKQKKVAGSNDLMRYFAGTYFSYTGGGVISGGTERRFVICANGQFYFSSESSYSGGAGTEDAWGAASQSGEAGMWSISGDKNSGQIELTYTNGETEIVNYQVCGDGCIYFNQIKYAYEKPADCE